MKHLSTLMSLLMFALTFADICGNAESKPSLTNTIQQTAEHQDDQPESCSPFCNCSRCAFSILVPQNLLSGIIIQSYPLFKAFHPEGLPVRVSATVWQPPKMV